MCATTSMPKMICETASILQIKCVMIGMPKMLRELYVEVHE
jgi:hypothetical protein